MQLLCYDSQTAVKKFWRRLQKVKLKIGAVIKSGADDRKTRIILYLVDEAQRVHGSFAMAIGGMGPCEISATCYRVPCQTNLLGWAWQKSGLDPKSLSWLEDCLVDLPNHASVICEQP